MVEEYVPVRLSHLLRDCSVGAIVRGPDSLMVVQDIRTWDRSRSDPLDREIRYVDRVRSALGIEQVLCSPPRATERGGTVVGWLPALRFPTWMRCLTCGLMHSAPWRRPRTQDSGGPSVGSENTGEAARAEGCVECGGRLEQAPWVLVHEEGYLADVPWHGLAHGASRNPEQRQCRADWTQAYLKLDETEAGRRVRCTRCGSSDSFSSGALPRIPFPPRTWQQPWMRKPPAQSPEALALLMEINDVRVHSALTRTALVIPPESRIRRGTVTDRIYGSTRSQLSIRNARSPLARKAAVRRLASEYRCTPDEIEQAISEIDRGYPLYGRSLTIDDLLADEYRALIAEIPDLQEDEDFVTEHYTHDWKALGRTLEAGIGRHAVNAVSNLIAVNRLKEIMVLKGFQRVGGERLTRHRTSRGESDWLPAIELYGEAMSSSHSTKRCCSAGRAVTLVARTLRMPSSSGTSSVPAKASPSSTSMSHPDFLLCHALAHLVIHRARCRGWIPRCLPEGAHLLRNRLARRRWRAS